MQGRTTRLNRNISVDPIQDLALHRWRLEPLQQALPGRPGDFAGWWSHEAVDVVKRVEVLICGRGDVAKTLVEEGREGVGVWVEKEVMRFSSPGLRARPPIPEGRTRQYVLSTLVAASHQMSSRRGERTSAAWR